MKNKKFCIIVLTLMIIATVIPVAGTETKSNVPCLPKPSIKWEATYGGDLIDWGNCIQKTSDGGYIISGTNFRNAWSLWYSYFYLIKIDANGNEEWHQIYGEYDSEHVAKSVQQTTDGGYIIAGFQGVTYKYDAVVQKTDCDGNIVWSCTFGDPDAYDNAQSVQQTSDGGYIITGMTNSYGAIGTDVLLIKIDSDGVEEWIQTLGGDNADAGICVQQTSDGGFIVVGESDSFSDSGDVYLVKTDASGNEEWYQTFGGEGWDGGYGIDQTLDGGYIIAGRYEGENWDFDVYLIKTDEFGEEEWSKTFGGSDYDEGYSVQQTSDGGYFITGYYTNTENYDPDVYLIKTNESGNEEWNQIIDNGDTEDMGYYGIETSEDEYIVTGYTGFYMDEVMDVWVIKLGVGNQAPNIPSIDGPINGKVGKEYEFTFISTDPEGDAIMYKIDWGDGKTEWTEYGDSGVEFTLTHSWTSQGTFTIKAKAIDFYDAESDWAEFTVTMPKDKAINRPILNFLQNHPNLIPLLQKLLQQLMFGL